MAINVTGWRDAPFSPRVGESRGLRASESDPDGVAPSAASQRRVASVPEFPPGGARRARVGGASRGQEDVSCEADPEIGGWLWLGATRSSANIGLRDMAARQARGLVEALGADRCVVWVRAGDSWELSGSAVGPLARISVSGGGEEMVGACARVDLSLTAGEPIFVLGCGRALGDAVTQLGLLSGAVATPSLMLPLGEEAVALLWLATADGLLDDRWRVLLPILAAHAGAALERCARLERLGRAFRELTEAIAEAIDARDETRAGFSRATAQYALLIARELDLDDTEIEEIEYAALWHGLGRLSVPDSLLRPSMPLSEAERAHVRAATAWGARKLADIDGLGQIAAMVRHQHERWDGTGGPGGLSGDEIPLGSRILAVATRFTAMTNARIDRGALGVVGGALETLARDAGHALDPTVTQALMRAMNRQQAGPAPQTHDGSETEATSLQIAMDATRVGGANAGLKEIAKCDVMAAQREPTPALDREGVAACVGESMAAPRDHDPLAANGLDVEVANAMASFSDDPVAGAGGVKSRLFGRFFGVEAGTDVGAVLGRAPREGQRSGRDVQESAA